MLITASQLPYDIALTGMNFNTSSVKTRPLPPQAVGPSLSGGDLKSFLNPSLTNIPCGLFSSDLLSKRMSVGLVGSIAQPLISLDTAEPIGIQGLSLTSAGDIFSHKWLFDKAMASHQGLEGLAATKSWCNTFINHCSRRVPLDNSSQFANEILNEEKHEPAIESQNPKQSPKKESVADPREIAPHTLADNYMNVLHDIGDMTYAKALASDITMSWENGSFVSNHLSETRIVEEKSRQMYLDDITSNVSRQTK